MTGFNDKKVSLFSNAKYTSGTKILSVVTLSLLLGKQKQEDKWICFDFKTSALSFNILSHEGLFTFFFILTLCQILPFAHLCCRLYKLQECEASS